MRFDVFALFPEVMDVYLQTGVLGKAQESSRIEVHLHHLRDYTTDRHRTTDDEPYGGGGGMVMKPEPIFAAVESILENSQGEVCGLLRVESVLVVYAGKMSIERIFLRWRRTR